MLSLTAFLSSPGTRKEVYLSSLFPWQLRSSPQLQHPRHSLVPYLSGRSRVVSLHGNGLTATSGRGGVEEAPHRGCVEERMGLSSHVVTGKAFQIFILFFFLFFLPRSWNYAPLHKSYTVMEAGKKNVNNNTGT